MRISDWSSDVCSSDLTHDGGRRARLPQRRIADAPGRRDRRHRRPGPGRRRARRAPSLGDASMADFTHFDAEGKAVMVDVSDKEVTERSAEAKGSVLMQPATLGMIRDGGVKKGDVLSVARPPGTRTEERRGGQEGG